MAISAAIVLAAGEGVRMKSSTPKVLHTLAGKSFIARVLAAVQSLDAQRIVVVVRHGKEQVSQAVKAVAPQALLVEQDDIPGTGRAVQCAMKALEQQEGADWVRKQTDPLIITAGDLPLLDTPTLSAMVQAQKDQSAVAMVLATKLDNPFGYGRIVRDDNGHFDRIVEQKDADEETQRIKEVNTSVYSFTPSVLASAVAHLDANNNQQEFYLTDALENAKQFGHVGVAVAADPLAVEGVNDRVQLSRLARLHNERVCEKWMREGVSIWDPSTTWIDDDVELAQDVTVLPGCFLQGHTVVGQGSEVGPYTTLIDATVGENAHVERARIQETEVGDRANIGPWTYLRPGNVLAEDTKAGAFVEMKKAHIDHGTKVPHLIYVGDSHIGHNSNLGGGTITANYDGKFKHHTEIGSNVHIGAGNMIVAPVTIGDDVTTGAGAVVRHNVDNGSMVYSENTQHEVKGWKPRYEREGGEASQK